MTTEWIAEGDLAIQLNVERAILRAERAHLLAGEVETQRGMVVWQKNAADRVAAKLGLATPTKNGAAETNGNETLTVFSQPGPNGNHFPNPRVIKARRANGEVVVVSVMDSRKFTTRLRGRQEPMMFTARKSPHGNHWLLIGREPRWPGQW